MAQIPEIEALAGTSFGLIADAHIHPGKGPPLPARLAEIFAQVDAIIALGDLGEVSGLDTLERIAPVVGVTGADDAPGDARIAGAVRVFAAGGLVVGAVFDGVKHGLFSSSDPLVPLANFSEAVTACFGRKLDVLLCASTHTPVTASAAGVLIVNPGSPTLADATTVAVLRLGDGAAQVVHATV